MRWTDQFYVLLSVVLGITLKVKGARNQKLLRQAEQRELDYRNDFSEMERFKKMD